jgi:DNA-directed RNA polymerase subunit RPC12/RpoP
MGVLDLFRRLRLGRLSPGHRRPSRIEEVSERGPFPKCGGCGEEPPTELGLAEDKKGNHGYLCAACSGEYADLLRPDSVRNFWMCGACGFRVLAGTDIDAAVDERGNACPNCDSDISLTLVNLKADHPVGSGLIGEPLD